MPKTEHSNPLHGPEEVLVRRGKKVLRIPAQRLVPYIRKKQLVASDEISIDGTRWVRLDHNPQLRSLFSSTEKQDPSTSFPAQLDDQLAGLAEMLKDINCR